MISYVVLMYLKIHIKFYGKDSRVKKVWFTTSKKSTSLYNRYSEHFENDIMLVNNRILTKESFLLLCDTLKVFDVLRTYKELRNEIILSLYKKELVNILLIIKYLFKSLYLSLLCHVFEKHKFDKVFITEKESSWGLMINTVCRKKSSDIIVIPHGVEYNYKLPNGYPGNKFYTTTFKAATELNKVYRTDKFIFDGNIASHVLKLTKTEKVKPNSIVYFPEGRNVRVDQRILGELIANGIKPMLCIHPLDKKTNYSKFNLKVISFDKAIQNSIVLSRNSTILLEALAYESLPISIICNAEDEIIKNSIPSLNLKEIHTVNSIQNLIKIIKKINMKSELSRNVMDGYLIELLTIFNKRILNF